MLKNYVSKAGKLINRIAESSKLGKKGVITVMLLISGIVLLLLSTSADEKNDTAVLTEQTTEFNSAEYASELEKRLTSIVSAIDGAGRVKVMVTLSSGSENIYLRDTNSGESIGENGKSSADRKDEYVIVDDGKSEKGIVVRVAEPKIRGVAVVCDGGNDERVKSSVIETVSALLDINSTAISVSRMKAADSE